jgi:hypothetical protein
VLNLKAKGIENAAAVLGGYDAMVRAGFAVEAAGKPAQAPAAVVSPKPADSSPEKINQTAATPEVKRPQAATPAPAVEVKKVAAPPKRKRRKRSTGRG